MTMKYQWTDWITHVPGQEMPAGTHGIWEVYGTRSYGGVPKQWEATITSAFKGHPCWYATDPSGPACVLTRYKLRSIAEETETVRDLALVE